MHRKYDFMSMEIFNLNGKRLGNVCDINLNFNEKRIEGFKVESAVPFRKNGFINRNDVVYYSENLIAKGYAEERGIPFSDINSMDIYNLDGEILGIVTDIIIDDNLELEGIVISSGVLKDLFDGRRIISSKSMILGEENIIYHGVEKIKFRNLVHL